MQDEIHHWTSVAKKVFYLVIIILFTIFSFKMAIFYFPFLIAFIISCILEPIIKKIMKKFNFSRKLSSIIVLAISFGVIFSLLVWGIITLISESTNLLSSINDYYTKAITEFQNLIEKIDYNKLKIPAELQQIINNSAISILDKISIYAQNLLTNMLKFFTSLPTIGIYFAITFLALYFISTDKIYMLDELEHHLPEKWMKKISIHLKDLIKTLGGYLKAQITLVFISFIICIIGLYIIYFLGLNIKFPLIIALFIAFIDALPILGAGTIMIPWGILEGFNGDLKLGFLIIGLWIIMSVVRQLVEPKIVSGNIGIHPIFTIVAMYTGFKVIGIIRNVFRTNSFNYSKKRFFKFPRCRNNKNNF